MAKMETPPELFALKYYLLVVGYMLKFQFYTIIMVFVALDTLHLSAFSGLIGQGNTILIGRIALVHFDCLFHFSPCWLAKSLMLMPSLDVFAFSMFHPYKNEQRYKKLILEALKLLCDSHPSLYGVLQEESSEMVSLYLVRKDHRLDPYVN